MPIVARSAKSLAMFVLAVGFTASAPAAPSLPPLVVAVRQANCGAAVKLVNAEGSTKDDRTAFVAGRMLDEGLCVKKNPEAATGYFARAADLGNRNAGLDYAAKVGLGEGTAQSYEVAGDVCRKAGLDPQASLSQYSLGYACTVLGVAGKLLRETLPQGAFLPRSRPARVEFSPGSTEIRILATPEVALGDPVTGSQIRQPLVDAQKEIKKAWGAALAAVPKPDATRLDKQSVELPLDVDMTLEAGRDAARRSGVQMEGTLLQGDLRQAGGSTPGH
jgi:hypothetical protein